MKKLLMAFMVFCAAVPAFALTPLGPPMTRLKQKQNSLGFVFARSEMDLALSGPGGSATVPDFKSDAYFARVSMGISDNWELYSLLGVSDLSCGEYDGTSEFAAGIGSKFTFAKNEQVTWGGIFQIIRMRSKGGGVGYDPSNGSHYTGVEVDFLDIQIAFGPTFTKEAFSIYGGPLLHFITGDMDVTVMDVTGRVDIEQKSEFGGYAGIMFDLAESSSLFIEYQMTGDASAFTGGIGWRF